MNKRLKKIFDSSEFYVFLIIIVLSIIIQIKSGLFFTNNNLVDLLRSLIVPSMYALCALLAFVSTGPDVSFPLIAALSGYIGIIAVEKIPGGGPWFLAYLIAIVIGCLCGALNGFILVKYRFPALIVTLGTSSIFNGLLLGAFQAVRKPLPKNLFNFGRSILISVKNEKSGLGSSLPVAFLLFIILYIIAFFVLNYTMAGRGLYALGGDEVAAERAGFNVNKIRFFTFVISGGIAAIAGVTYAAMSQRYLPTEYEGGEMIVIAAIVLGGTSLTGGSGTLIGCILGTFLLNMVTNSLILVGINVYWQKIFIGIIIMIGTVATSMKASRKPSRAKKKNGGKQ